MPSSFPARKPADTASRDSGQSQFIEISAAFADLNTSFQQGLHDVQRHLTAVMIGAAVFNVVLTTTLTTTFITLLN